MRHLLLALLLAPVLTMAADYLFYSGTYTDDIPRAVYAWRFHSNDGSMTPLGLTAATPEPAHIWITPDGKYLYTVNWIKDGTVSAYAINRHTGALIFLN